MIFQELRSLMISVEFNNLFSVCEERNKLSIVLQNYKNFDKHKLLQKHEMTVMYWKILLDLTKIVSVMIQNNCISTVEMNFVIETLRCFRNSCAGCCRDEQLICRSEKFLKIPLKILICLIGIRSNATENDVIALRCCLQIFGNVVCQSVSSKDIVWKSFNEMNLFRNLLSDTDLKLQEYIMMILYHCMKPKCENYLLHTEDGSILLIEVANVLTQNLNNWGILIMESIICEVKFFDKCYILLPPESRLLVLDIIAEFIENVHTSIIHETTFIAIKNVFIENASHMIDSSNLNEHDLKPIELTKLLSVLCIASVDKNYCHHIQNYPDLLESSIATLKCIHLLGKQSRNSFSTIFNLQNVSDWTKEEMEKHPTYCFKRNLIRIIGNMCFKNRLNQDVVRENDGIPLLLDCCNIDIRNPYIMQWCILAIRNILEKNHDNQVVLASITITEELINTPLLNELGVIVNLENGKSTLKFISE